MYWQREAFRLSLPLATTLLWCLAHTPMRHVVKSRWTRSASLDVCHD
jgi:hypothetical protein